MKIDSVAIPLAKEIEGFKQGPRAIEDITVFINRRQESKFGPELILAVGLQFSDISLVLGVVAQWLKDE